MAQFARPDADGSSQTWTPSAGARYDCINESVADDADYISVLAFPTVAVDNVVRLSDVTDPVSSSGHVIRARAKTSGGTGDMAIVLWQGEPDGFGAGTQIGKLTISAASTSFTDYSYTLTGTEADNITNYNDLWLEIRRETAVKGATYTVSQAYFEVPSVGSVEVIAFAQIKIQATVKAVRVRTATGVAQVKIQAFTNAVNINLARGFAQVVVQSTAKAVRLRTTTGVAQVKIQAFTNAVNINLARGFAQVVVQSLATGRVIKTARTQNQVVVRAFVSTSGVRIGRAIGQVAILSTATATKLGGRRRVFIIT